MALKPCPGCNEQISDRVRYCPHCGANIWASRKDTRIAMVLLFILLALWMGWISC
jgi:hypothetical protein